ncbi:MAG: cytochrome c biogenesis protein CcsA [Pseudoxanthomonas suwonensis]|nr:cytochrome c biogenesis protein CcsA [Pseudoxanthomonas suwonensis]
MTLVLIAIVTYLLATAGVAHSLVPARRTASPLAWLAGVFAMVIHGLVHVLAWQHAGAPDMHFFAALSLTGLGMALLTTVLGASGRMPALAIVVHPIAALSLVAYAAQDPVEPQLLDWRLQLHAWSALLAYATLAVAALLAVLLWFQERALRRRQLSDWLRVLPPLQDLEFLLFRTIGFGFILLSATLLTGALFVENLLAQHLVHKTVLSVLSWLAFGALLLGRWRRGWRGRIAVRWTLLAMALLVLAFFGSKFVLEMLLGRG